MSTPADPLVIAIDSSTSASKAVVVDVRGNVLSEGKADIELLSPEMNHYEHNPIQWWTSTRDAIKEATAALEPADRARVAALCITHQRESFVLVDDDGAALRPAILWLDSRAGAEIKEFGSAHIHELSGKPADTTPALYKMAWLKRHEPELLAAADKVVDVHAYLAKHLVGRWVSAMGSADTLNLMDIAHQDYADELLDIAGVRRDQMAELAAPASIIGEIDPELLTQWGLPDGVVLVAGVGDGQAAGTGTRGHRARCSLRQRGYLHRCGCSFLWIPVLSRLPHVARRNPRILRAGDRTRTPARSWVTGSARSLVTRSWRDARIPSSRPRRPRCHRGVRAC